MLASNGGCGFSRELGVVFLTAIGAGSLDFNLLVEILGCFPLNPKKIKLVALGQQQPSGFGVGSMGKKQTTQNGIPKPPNGTWGCPANPRSLTKTDPQNEIP